MKIKKQTAIIALIVFLLLATAGLVAATMIPSAEDLLISSLETLESITTGHGVVRASADWPEQDVNGTFEIWGSMNAGPNGEPAAKVVVQSSNRSELVGLTFVSDGSQFWLYSPDQSSVIVGQAEELAPILAERLAEYQGQYGDQWDHSGEFDSESADHPQTPAEAVAKLLEYFTAERDGSGQVGEYNTDILRLVPIAEKMPEEIRLAGGYLNLWLQTGDQLPLAAEYAESALGYFKIEASQVQVNEPIDDGIFTFIIPEGVEVIEAADLLAQMDTLKIPVDAAEAGALTPGELPLDAEPAGSEQIAGTIVQRFTLPGNESFFIAQGMSVPQDVPAEATTSQAVTVRGFEGTLHTNEQATRTLLVWQEAETQFLVGGDLSPEQALAVAESLQ